MLSVLVVGYKQFHDALDIEWLLDVLTDRDLDWTNAKRIERTAPTEHERIRGSESLPE